MLFFLYQELESESSTKAESRPISRVLSRTVIPLGRASPRASSGLPGSTRGLALQFFFKELRLPYLALLQVGFAVPSNVATDAVRSYRTVSPLPVPYDRYFGGLLSVALSVGSRPPGVTWHPARRARTFLHASSRAKRSDCPADSPRLHLN